MKKRGKQFIFILIAIGILLGTSNISVMAKSSDSVSNPKHYCTRKHDDSDTTKWSYIYFGNYPQTEVTGEALTDAIINASYDSDDNAWVGDTKYHRIKKKDANHKSYFGSKTYRYFKWEPIKWRVLKSEGDTLFVISDKALDCREYNDKYKKVTWRTCTLRKWLNNTFYETAFLKKEQSAIVAKKVDNLNNQSYNTKGGKDTSDKIYLLSIAEVVSEEYGFCGTYSTSSVSRRMATTDFAHAIGAGANGSKFEENCIWWLRSPGRLSNCAASIDYYGYTYRTGYSVDFKAAGVVPVLHIKKSSDCWSKKAKDVVLTQEDENAHEIRVNTSREVKLLRVSRKNT